MSRYSDDPKKTGAAPSSTSTAIKFPAADNLTSTHILFLESTAVASILAVPPNSVRNAADQEPIVLGGTAIIGNNIWVSLAKDGRMITYQLGAPTTTVSSTPSVAASSPTSGDAAVSPPITAQPSRSEATSSATQSSVANSQSAKGGNDLSTGAIAGIVIGCLAAGAMIAGFALWFCWRRRRTARSRQNDGNTIGLMSQEKGFIANATTLAGPRSTAAAAGSGLPQPLEDKAISGDVSKISNSIKNHVQSYYHTSRVSSAFIDHEDLHALGTNLPIAVGTLHTLMGNSTTREIALRFVIAWVVVSRMQPSKDPLNTLLPAEVADCYQDITIGSRAAQAHGSLTARWRAITAELTQSNYVRNPFTPSDSRLASIKDALAVLDNVLRPYADSRMNNGERKRNLEELLKRSALFAFTLFSQPSAFEFEWQEEQCVTLGELCIFPALVQVADEKGQMVSPPRPFSEAVVRRLDT